MFQRLKKLTIIHGGYIIYITKIKLSELRCKIFGHRFVSMKPKLLPEKYNKDIIMPSIRHKGIFYGITGDIYAQYKNTLLKHCPCGTWKVDIV